jgi:hypothetical protein
VAEIVEVKIVDFGPLNRLVIGNSRINGLDFNLIDVNVGDFEVDFGHFDGQGEAHVS